MTQSEPKFNSFTVEWICEQTTKYRIIKGSIDKFRFTLLSKAFKQAGFNTDKKTGNMTIIRPSDQMLIAPTINSVFTKQKIIWGDNPLMCWYTNNTKRKVDDKGNVTFEKIEAKTRKTDGFMALVAAMTNVEILDKYSKPRKKLPDVGTY